MRYFLVSFNLKNKSALASLCFESENFPSQTFIESNVSKQCGYTVSIVVLNVFEFKNKEDYVNFNS